MENKTSEAQKKASRNWEDRNRSKATIGSYKRSARTFINNHASLEELEELEILINNRRNFLKNI